MIRNLYINEELIVSLTKDNRLNGIIKKEYLSKEIDSNQLSFIREYPDVMSYLKEGQDLQIATDGNVIKSSIDKETGSGYSIPSSVNDLEFNLNAKRR